MDLSHLVTSNHPPDPSEARILRDELASAVSEVSDLDKSLEKLAVVVAGLQKRKSLLNTLVDTLTGILSPIRVVPPEILAAIFQRCCDDARASKFNQYSITDVLKAPMLLTHVSSRWRTLCLSIQNLWVHFDIFEPPRIPFEPSPVWTIPSPSFVHDLLRRSGTQPLHLDFAVPRYLSSAPRTHRLQQLLTFLLQQDRWEDMRLDLDTLELPMAAWRQSGPFPRLRSLEILVKRTSTAIGSLAAPNFAGIFDSAPILRRVTIACYGTPLAPWMTAFRLSQLTVLDLHGQLDLIAGRAILVQCVALTHCTVGFEPTSADEDIRTMGEHRLCHLRFLHFEFSFTHRDINRALHIFLAAFQFPSLTSLTICSKIWFTDLLPRLHSRAPFALENLVLDRFDLQIVDILPFLKLIPSLEAIELKDCRLDDTILTALTFDPGALPQLALPHVRSVTISDVERAANEPPESSGSAVANLATSVTDGRNTIFPALRCLKLLMWEPEFDDDAIRRLRRAIGTGLVKYFENGSV
ncbi:hypothetical protein C8R46DRAFT_437961 [Mycena filopes]|nr:hypothetical protein C8R46DRAFT_437961 [Mycena filopes]